MRGFNAVGKEGKTMMIRNKAWKKRVLAGGMGLLLLLAAGCDSQPQETSSAPPSEAASSQVESSSQEPSSQEASSEAPSSQETSSQEIESSSQEAESSSQVSSSQAEPQSAPEIPEDPSAAPYWNEGIVMYGSMALEAFYDCQPQAADYAEVISSIKRSVPSATVYNIVVPTHVEFALPEKYKAEFSVSQRPTLDAAYQGYTADVVGVDIYNVLSLHKLEYLYFNTDHHWTGLGAYYAYTEFANAAGFSPLPLESMEKRSIPGLYGLLYDITKDPVLDPYPDTVEYFVFPGEFNSTVVQRGSAEWQATSIFAEYASGANAYGVFLGGDSVLFKIQNQDPAMAGGKKIAVLKESFGNAFAPFLAPHYSEVHIIDMRYWEGNLADYAAENGISEILVINNIKSACNYTMHEYLMSMT